MASAAAGRLAILVLLAALASGCEIIGGIFKAGVWTGLIVAALVIAVVIWLLRRMVR